MILNALAGKPLPVYGDGLQRARLALRARTIARRSARCWRDGRLGETYNIGGENEKPNIDIVRDDLRACSTSCGRDAGRPLRAPDHVRQGPAGPRPPLRDRRAQDRARARLAARRKPSRRASARPCSGTSTTREWVAGRAERRLPRLGRATTRTARPSMKILLLGSERPGRLGAAALARRRSARWSRSTPTAAILRADFTQPDALAETVRAVRPDVDRQRRGLHRGRQGRSRARRSRAAINADGRRRAGARGGRRAAPGWSTTAPTTSSTAAATQPRRRGRADRPAERLRPHQARRRGRDPRQRLQAPDPAHELGLRRARRQLREDDAAAGRASATELHGRSTTRSARRPAPSCWPTSRAHALARAARAQPELAGTYHAAAAGETSWHGYARLVIEAARERGVAV